MASGPAVSSFHTNDEHPTTGVTEARGRPPFPLDLTDSHNLEQYSSYIPGVTESDAAFHWSYLAGRVASSLSSLCLGEAGRSCCSRWESGDHDRDRASWIILSLDSGELNALDRDIALHALL